MTDAEKSLIRTLVDASESMPNSPALHFIHAELRKLLAPQGKLKELMIWRQAVWQARCDSGITQKWTRATKADNRMKRQRRFEPTPADIEAVQASVEAAKTEVLYGPHKPVQPATEPAKARHVPLHSTSGGSFPAWWPGAARK